MFGVVIVGENPRRLILLAEQIERHVPEVKLSGIICRLPSRSPITFRSRVTSVLSRVTDLGSRVVLEAIHGGPLKISDEDILSDRLPAARQGSSVMHFTDNLESDETQVFQRNAKADLTVVVGPTRFPTAPEAFTTDCIIAGQLSSMGKQTTKTAPFDRLVKATDGVEVTVTEWNSRGQRRLVGFELYPEPLDTSVSLELKSNLILRDLLVQSVAALAQQAADAPAQVQKWVRSMIPSYLWRTEKPEIDSSVDQAPPLRVRANWKLCVYSFFLLSPPVILRNWLYRRRKQYPICFLNSHLISDRRHRMTLSTEAFLRVVGYLKRYYRIVSFYDACRLLKTGRNDRPTLVLTFDDGYEDNFVNLRAVCQEMGIPVALFVSTDPVTLHREFAHDFSRGLLGFRALTWSQIRYWSAEGAEFHSHTCSHFDCGSTDEALLTKELTESKRVLEEQLGKPVTAVAFPFGKSKNMSVVAMDIAARTYDHFLSSFGGENRPSASNKHKHLLRKHLLGNAWESELDIQNVFTLGRPAR